MNKLPNDPVILKAMRSPIGKYGGILSSLRPDDMLASIMRDTMTRTGLDASLVDEVVVGCANQGGEDNRNIARMAVLLAGFPDGVPAITLNRLCASGLDAIIDSARRIIVGDAHLVLAAGVESMTRAPYIMAKSSSPFKLGSPDIYDSSLGWRFYNEKMRDRTPPEHNGVTAERLVKLYGIDRKRQDRFALRSHQKAVESQRNGFFEQEIIPLFIRDGLQMVDTDEGPRSDTSLEKLASLKSVFVADGTVTAGNSSSLNDGAAVVLVSSYAFAKAHNIAPLARIVGFASAGVDPRTMGVGPVPAIKKLLEHYTLTLSDFGTVEINEA